MNFMYRPTGSVVQLMDGRVFKRNKKNQNLWENINTGAMITEQQLNLMITSAAFTADASGGGNTRRETASPTSVSLSAPFGDIVVTADSTETFNANRTIIIIGSGPATLRVTFASVGTYNSGTFKAYKNDVQINSVRVGSSSGGLVTTLSETFADGDQLKFSYSVPTADPHNFDVTLEKTAPGSTDVLGVFNISTPAP
jgi:hypothetical protein